MTFAQWWQTRVSFRCSRCGLRAKQLAEEAWNQGAENATTDDSGAVSAFRAAPVLDAVEHPPADN